LIIFLFSFSKYLKSRILFPSGAAYCFWCGSFVLQCTSFMHVCKGGKN